MRYTGFFPCSLFPVPCSLFSVPCSLFPKTKDSVPHPIKNRYIPKNITIYFIVENPEKCYDRFHFSGFALFLCFSC
ncbi:MAG: hypothetical protein F6J98_11980 [Moorea sp. SIO4G2]|nr:hypothetical protein [Moorena sp. SIO4A3]NEO61122.1 hypothetical protein [Moorena sp. SIO4G2]